MWACTACGACVDICPVGNEPMHDPNIRRDAVLMQSEFPAQLQTAFKGHGTAGQSLGSKRKPRGVGDWPREFPVPTFEENPNFDILYWTGCAVSS